MNRRGLTILICKADEDVCVSAILTDEMFRLIYEFRPLFIFWKKSAL